MEETLDLRSLMLAVMKRWRILLALALIGALLAGGYKAVVLSGGLGEDELAEQQKYLMNLQNYELQTRSLTQELASLSAFIDKRSSYRDSSVLMKIDPYDVSVSEFSFFIDTGYQILPDFVYQTPDYTSQLTNAYALAGSEQALLNTLAKSLADDGSISFSAVKELFTISSPSSGIVIVRVIGSDATLPKAMATTIYEYLKAKRPFLETTIGLHTLSDLSQSSYTVVDADLARRQQAVTTELLDLTTNYNKKNAELTGLTEPKDPLSSPARDIVLFTILGALLGGGISAVFILMGELMSPRLRSCDELSDRYQIAYLGSITLTWSKRGFGNWLDRLVESIFRSKDGPKIPEQQLALVAANLRFIARELDNPQSPTRVLLTGSISPGTLRDVGTRLSTSAGSKFAFVSGGSVQTDPTTLDLLQGSDVVLLVERLDVSSNTTIDKEIGRIRELGKQIHGLILV